ncbi:MAG: DUF4435 domain-containing protein [Gammaproteobacteria bacterium]|nr:DUF4435 domain-containing protein [Gammaproteobacteria bacterium]
MEQSLESIVDSVVFARSSTAEPILFVEGGSDVEFFRRFVTQTVAVVAVGDKEKVISAMHLVAVEEYRAVAGVVDVDFGRIDDTAPRCPGLFLTDDHDIEMMIVRSGAFEDLVTALASRPKLEKFGRDVRLAVLQGAAVIGQLRYVSRVRGLSLRFEGLPIGKLVEDDLSVDERKLIGRVLALSGRRENGVTFDRLLELMAGRAQHDLYQICCGHDVMEVVGKALRRVVGNRSGAETKREHLERILRLAYDGKFLARTSLYRDLYGWARESGIELFDAERVDSPAGGGEGRVNLPEA